MKGFAQNRGLFGVLLLLLVVVVVPTACVLWFMTVAMRNERLAVRQTLTAAYQSQLLGLNQQLRSLWEDKQAALASVEVAPLRAPVRAVSNATAHDTRPNTAVSTNSTLGSA